MAKSLPFSMSAKRFIDEKYAFSVGIPEGWHHQQMDEKFIRFGGVLALESPDGKSSFNVSRGSPRQYENNWKEYVISTFKQFMSQTKNPNNFHIFNEATLGSEQNVIRAEFTSKRWFRPSARFGKVCALHNGVEYVIYYFFSEGSKTKIDLILDSWEFR
ncbi:MAG: hypothetical protein A2W23_08555 [Planctomycetes bacterium RBG_16_43_13]|nr:MAG: hypothetical protein A2W23_08555 [Planctomycetes bacterium RBG_16_43_13]